MSQDDTGKIHHFNYYGRLSYLYAIIILTVLISIITLGVYIFWGRTKLRRYISSNFTLDDERFEYTGTGYELFIGFLKIFPIILLIFIISEYNLLYISEYDLLNITENYITIIYEILLVITLYYLYLISVYSALRYRLSRLTWRGIRGQLRGSAFYYARLVFVRFVLNLISLGLVIPNSDIKIHRYRLNNASFGNVACSFSGGDPRALRASNIKTLLLAIPTLTLSRFWYRAARDRYLYARTLIGPDLAMRTTYTGGNLLRLYLVNFLILIFTLGLGYPIALHRVMKFYARHISICGTGDMTIITQSDTLPGGAGGDSFNSALDGGFI